MAVAAATVALIAGAGELVYQFTKLVKGAGGFGAAIDLLKDVVLDVWNRIGLGAAAAWSKIEASWGPSRAPRTLSRAL